MTTINFNPEQGEPKPAKATRVITGEGQMTETVTDEHGKTIKISVFLDRNGDNQYTPNEVVSVKYVNTYSRSQNTIEYRDTDGDGYSDEIVKSDWTGNETVTKEEGQTKGQRMDYRYGFKWDAEQPIEPLLTRPLLDENGNPIRFNE